MPYSLSDQYRVSDGRPSGFDYMRLFLSLAVIGLHSVIICYGQMVEIEFWQSHFRPVLRLILPMFFALSGFLVAGSLMRSRTLGVFIGLRIIRIFPALSVEVVLSALLLGPFFTSLTLAEYFTDPIFFAYFLNIVGHVHFTLPGVFQQNPHPYVVNGQLWTVPYELYCYISLCALAFVGAVRMPWLFVSGALGLLAASVVFKIVRDGAIPGFIIGPVPGIILVICFLFGVLLHIVRKRVAFNHFIGVLSGLLSAVSVWFVPYGEFILPLPVAYFTVYLGLLNPPRMFLVDGVDFSYGLFLYGYPIQQALAATSVFFLGWTANFVGSVALGILFAAMSWRFIEKPALNFRKVLYHWEEKWVSKRDPGSERS